MTTRPLSDSFFDLPPEPAFDVSSIAEWRKDIPAPVSAEDDYSFSSDIQDMTTADLFDRKDTISECSMDSAYQSQSGASYRGHAKPEGVNLDSKISANAQFVSNEIFSPSMSSDSYTLYPEHGLEMMQLPPSAGAWDAPESSGVYANYSSGQGYPQSAANTSHLTGPSTMGMSSSWGSIDAPFQGNAFAFSYPTDQPAVEPVFNSGFPSQQQWETNIEAIESSATCSSASVAVNQNSRRASINDSNFGAFVMTPTSTASPHFPQTFELDQPHANGRMNDDEDTASISQLTQSLDDTEDMIGPSSAAETKLEEERTKVARSHPLYQQLPDKDGKYHCPEEGKVCCTHKPTPLKCNYDKYVDSHLKPFRCHKESCVGVQFSSTACLLRHEREAHGMHGHGARPHLCHFKDCERAVPGHGFPRRYNLFDHMKRVHQYDGPTTEISPSVGDGQVPRKLAGRKRKSTAEDTVEKRQKVAKPTPEQLRQQARDALSKEFMVKRQHIVDILSNLSGPSDLRDDIELTKAVVGLHDICSKFRSHGG